MLLRDRLVSSGPRYYEETRAMIKKLLGGHSEDDIAMDSLKISLICPVGFYVELYCLYIIFSSLDLECKIRLGPKIVRTYNVLIFTTI